VKKLIDDPANAFTDALEGFALAHADRVEVRGLDGDDPLLVVRKGGAIPGKVGLISGGGSGHEPLHIGYVGDGMLDAAAAGSIFTSPTPDQFAAAVQAADGGAGVVAIIKNYTGDLMNFDVAKELLGDEGPDTEMVLVADDVSVENSTHSIGRRGVAGTLIVERMAGAAAARGDDLASVAAIARRTAENLATMGIAMTSCTVPEVGKPSFEIGPDEMEFGVGIHGEPGRSREPFTNATDIADRLLAPILADLAINAGERVLLFVNGMGATPLSELYVLYNRARASLESRGIAVSRSLVGDLVTALEMQGASITVCRVDDELETLWDAPLRTIALTW
jgi:dihydroxyacetone kinase-like protein